MSLDELPGTVPPEQQEREARLVQRVAASFGATPDPRLKDLMQALTRHLHAFLRETHAPAARHPCPRRPGPGRPHVVTRAFPHRPGAGRGP